MRQPLPNASAKILRVWLTIMILLGAAPAAPAATVFETITGTLIEGTDWTGMFVGKEADLTGYPVKILYTLDTTGGELWGNQTACDNGRINSGLQTPVPKAVLTINGKSFTFGALKPGTITAWVDSGSATSPKTIFNTWFGANFPFSSTAMYGADYCGQWISLSSIESDASCRNWADGFIYTLKPADVGAGEWAIQHATVAKGYYQDAEAYFTVKTVAVSGPITPPITPHIFFFDASKNKTVDATESPQSVEAGQRIQLFAVPAGTGITQPWAVEDSQGHPAKLVEDYTTPPIPAIPGVDAAPAFVTPATPATFSDPQTTTFYWVTPGTTSPNTFKVTYQYTLADGKPASVEATFEVDGPTATQNSVTTVPPAPETNYVNVDNLHHLIQFGLEGGPGYAYNGITFNQDATNAKTHDGFFFWTQLLSYHETYFINGTAYPQPVYLNSLDNTFPFAPACYHAQAVDSPRKPIDPTWSRYQENIFFTMYLMWSPCDASSDPLPNTIPVPLGFVPWFVEADVTQTNGVLSPQPAGKGGAQSLFVPITSPSLSDPAKGFPQWTHVDKNGSGSPVPPCP